MTGIICLFIGHTPDWSSLVNDFVPIEFTSEGAEDTMQWFPCRRCRVVISVRGSRVTPTPIINMETMETR